MSYLYLLVDSNNSGFKIGNSVNPSRRIAELPEVIDIPKSFQIRCSLNDVYRIEKTLHFLFRNWSLEKDRGDGYTEWFSIECLDAVKDFIRMQQALLGCAHFEEIPIAIMGISKQKNVTNVEKARRKAAREEKERKEILWRCQSSKESLTGC